MISSSKPAEQSTVTSIMNVVVSAPQPFVVINSTFTVPDVMKSTLGVDVFDVAGVPPGKVQLKSVTSLELLPSNDTTVGHPIVLSANVIKATGGSSTSMLMYEELEQEPNVPVIEKVVFVVGFAV